MRRWRMKVMLILRNIQKIKESVRNPNPQLLLVRTTTIK